LRSFLSVTAAYLLVPLLQSPEVTGILLPELIALELVVVHLSQKIIAVRNDKDSRQRLVPFSVKTALALTRYLRRRKEHQDGALPAL
jgi:site-specific recombinase XerD